MKTKRMLAYIDVMIDLIDRDTINFFLSGPDYWQGPFQKTKKEKRTLRLKSDRAHKLLIKVAGIAKDE